MCRDHTAHVDADAAVLLTEHNMLRSADTTSTMDCENLFEFKKCLKFRQKSHKNKFKKVLAFAKDIGYSISAVT